MSVAKSPKSPEATNVFFPFFAPGVASIDLSSCSQKYALHVRVDNVQLEEMMDPRKQQQSCLPLSGVVDFGGPEALQQQ